MLRLAVLSVISTIAVLGMQSDGAVASAAAPAPVTEQAIGISSDGSAAVSHLPGDGHTVARALTDPAAPLEPEPARESDDENPTTTVQDAPSDDDPNIESTTTVEKSPPEEGEDYKSPTTTVADQAAPQEGGEQESTTTLAAAVPDTRGRPGRISTSPKVSDSSIPIGSIVLALFVLASVGAVSYRLFRRRPDTPESDETPPPEAVTDQPPGPVDATVDPPVEDRTSIDSSKSDFLIGLGEALMDAGAAVSHVESALRTVARAVGAGSVGVIVLPTAIIVSVPDGEDLVTEIGDPGRAQLRFDQIDDVLSLVREAETGAVGAVEGGRRLAEIRSAPPRYSQKLALFGHMCASAGLAAILLGTWVEVGLAALLGAFIGAFRLWTGHRNSAYQPFIVLISATAVSISVFALSRVIDDLFTFPLLFAPLITFLPGGMLTIAVLELATGQVVSGASRLAGGGLQLLLMALGIVAGAQLVGVPSHEVGSSIGGTVAVLTPWLGVAVLGVGLVWFYGARSSARIWILLVMFVAYAGQVIGGLFFGSALSAFFGALAMTPVAILASRMSKAPSSLVTILPGFWLLVPGSLGINGVTRLFAVGGATATEVLATTLTSMVGVSLGILLGLLLVAKDPDHPWSEARIIEQPEPSPEQSAPGTSPH